MGTTAGRSAPREDARCRLAGQVAAEVLGGGGGGGGGAGAALLLADLALAGEPTEVDRVDRAGGMVVAGVEACDMKWDVPCQKRATRLELVLGAWKAPVQPVTLRPRGTPIIDSAPAAG